LKYKNKIKMSLLQTSNILKQTAFKFAPIQYNIIKNTLTPQLRTFASKSSKDTTKRSE